MFNIVNYRGFSKSRRFGVELEINNTVSKKLIAANIDNCSDRQIKFSSWSQSRNNNFWHIKQDSTCGILGVDHDVGWEVASFVGRGEDDVDHMGTVAQALLDGGCETNENCGLHVHVEVSDFDCYQMGILLANYIKLEWALMDIVPQHRWDNPYCKPLYTDFTYQEQAKYWSPAELWLRMKPDNLKAHNNPCRWQSINLVNFAMGLNNDKWNRKTVEFRLPDCSLVGFNVKNWIRLFVNFVEYCSKAEMPINLNRVSLRKVLMYLGLGHESDKFYILSKELMWAKTWFLRRYLRFNSSIYNNNYTNAKKILNEIWNPVRWF